MNPKHGPKELYCPYFLDMQTEKVELETTVVDETKEREAHAGQGNGRVSGQ